MTRVASGALVEYVEGTFRGDAYVYRIELQPESGRAGQERS